MQPTALDAPILTTSTVASSSPALIAERLWFSHANGAPALRGVDLSIARGQVTMILGRSGSGKTTLLRVLKGLLRPQRGAVRWPDASPPRVAYIPQTLGLVRSRSALENVLTGALALVPALPSLAGVFPAPVVTEARRLMDQLGIGDKTQEPVCRLSGGERQRVAIARALIARPELILADEFVSQLDAVTTRQILEMTCELARRGTGVLMTSHDPELVAGYADWLMIMTQGEITFRGRPEELSPQQMVERLA